MGAFADTRVPHLPAAAHSGASGLPSDPQRLENVKCSYWSLCAERQTLWSLAGCLKSRGTSLVARTPGVGRPPSQTSCGSPLTSWQLLQRVPFCPETSRHERFQAAQGEQIKTMLEGE